jgi:1-acyl-sn-glycerol-3-phosphate acyltransferase
VIAALIRLAAGVETRWVGLDPVGPDGRAIQRLYFANHASHLDAPILWSALPTAARARTRPVAAREYWARDLRWVLSSGMRAVFVERCGLAAEACAPMEDALRSGDSLILFPEGTRNLEPELGVGPFKSGLYHLARTFPEVEVVPVALTNVGRMLPKGHLAPVPLLVGVTFGAPVPLRLDDDKERFLTRARDALQRLSAPEAP